MPESGLMGGLYRICEWIMRLAFGQLLWIALTILGLGLFGFFPATAALFALSRQWIMKKEVPLFKYFWGAYKREFVKANALGYLLVMSGYALYFYANWFASWDHALASVLMVAVMAVALIYVLTVVFAMPVLVHFDVPFKDYVKYTLIVALSSPHFGLLMLAVMVAVYYVSTLIPALILFFSFSVTTFVMMQIAMLAFNRLKQKKQPEEEPA